MRLRNYFVIGAICAMLFAGWTLADEGAGGPVKPFTESEAIENLTKDLAELHEEIVAQTDPLSLIDLDKVESWEIVKAYAIDHHDAFFEARKNPDLTHVIRHVLLMRLKSGRLVIGAAFYMEGELFVYERGSPRSELTPRAAPLNRQQQDFIYFMLHSGAKGKEV